MPADVAHWIFHGPPTPDATVRADAAGEPAQGTSLSALLTSVAVALYAMPAVVPAAHVSVNVPPVGLPVMLTIWISAQAETSSPTVGIEGPFPPVDANAEGNPRANKTTDASATTIAGLVIVLMRTF